LPVAVEDEELFLDHVDELDVVIHQQNFGHFSEIFL
jgi:hypothetical protein